jgi:5-oxopent-3-ene-1,2,5-tricarboxylate decarboxylase / 2-hydroxyhepta-2,4-diene-1,7-dioate isomerase
MDEVMGKENDRMNTIQSNDPEERTIFENLLRVSTDSAWAVCTKLGYRDTFIAGLQVTQPDKKMVGRAITLRYLPVRADLSETTPDAPTLTLAKRAVELAGPGDILVVDSGGDTGGGFLGDVIATRFIVRGGAGMVVDGAIRDLHYLRTVDLPFYIRAAHAGASHRTIVGMDLNIPVRCAGVTVIPGDILLGDAQGVLVIPRAIAAEVAETAAATEHKENFLRETLLKGIRPIHEVYPPNDEVMAEYLEFKRRQEAGG